MAQQNSNSTESNKILSGDSVKDTGVADIIPDIVTEVLAESPAPATSPDISQKLNRKSKRLKSTKRSEIMTSNATRRKNDVYTVEENQSIYVQGVIKLRDKYANRLFFLLAGEIIITFTIVLLYGFGVINLEGWLVTIIAESIIVKTFLTVQMIVQNLFPNTDLVGLIFNGAKK